MYGRGMTPILVFTGGTLAAADVAPVMWMVFAALLLLVAGGLAWRSWRLRRPEATRAIQAVQVRRGLPMRSGHHRPGPTKPARAW